MKTSLSTKSFLVIASLAAVISAATAFQGNTTNQQNAVSKVATQKMQKVVVSAKRMSAEEKLSFDLQNSAMQTVVISAKRLTEEQKLAIDAQERAQQTGSAKAMRATKG
jgi:hypothetical protein